MPEISLERFRFHTGSIKSLSHASKNSRHTSFRFHTGSIKSLYLTEIYDPMLRFDSILVRLKATPATSSPKHANIGFDSILVRLKVCAETSVLPSREFRFHTGSIKSSIGWHPCEACPAVSIPYWFD